jgi:hypothetical protein
MDTPANLGPAGEHEHRIRGVYSDIVRAVDRRREQDPGLIDTHVAEALRRLQAKYGG